VYLHYLISLDLSPKISIGIVICFDFSRNKDLILICLSAMFGLFTHNVLHLMQHVMRHKGWIGIWMAFGVCYERPCLPCFFNSWIYLIDLYYQLYFCWILVLYRDVWGRTWKRWWDIHSTTLLCFPFPTLIWFLYFFLH